jgi:hypothetical protein
MQPFPNDESKDLDQETLYILLTLGGFSPDPSPNLDWKRFVDVACGEGVAGILYDCLKDKDIPQSTISSLKRYYLSVAAQNLVFLNVLENLEHELERHKIEIILLKGASLLENTYLGVGLRPMIDLDLMVRPRDQKRFFELLHTQGYRCDPSIPHIVRKGGVLLDVHSHALNADRIENRARLFPLGMDPIWAHSVSWQEGYKFLKRPDDVDNTLLLCQHAMKHSFSILIWLVDIHGLLRDRNSAFWARLFKRADYLSQIKSLRYTLFLLKGLFGLEAPQGTPCGNSSIVLSRLERGILKTRIRGQTLHRLGPLMALLCIKGAKARIAFLWETLFPKKEVIEQEFLMACHGKRRFFYSARLFEVTALAFKQVYLIVAGLIRG